MAVPALSPLQVPELLCSQCCNLMRIKIVRQGNGKLAGPTAKAYCDSEGCKYSFDVNLAHSNGQSTAKYDPPVESDRRLSGSVMVNSLEHETRTEQAASQGKPGTVAGSQGAKT